MIPDGTLARTFIVRLRLEPDAAGQADEWRGEVERVPDGARGHFLGLDGIIEAMKKLLPEPDR